MTDSATPQDAHEALLELCRCLRMHETSDEVRALRQRLNAGGWAGVVTVANERSLLPALAAAVERKQLSAGIPARRSADGQMTITAALAEGVTQHREIRATKLARLIELTALLNAAGIEPIILKGARSLWTGLPDWRAMGDLDLLTPGRATEAQDIAIRAGYAPMPDYDHPSGWHHEINLYRGDLPGWLELHNRAAMYPADLLLPTERLIEDSLADPRHGVVVRILPPPLDLLFCAVHHHVSDRGDKVGTMSMKGLYEFATGFAALTPAERERLSGLAATHPRLVAILDYWLAAAADRFGLVVEAPFAVEADAAARWRSVGSRGGRRGRYAGLSSELSLSWSGRRLRRAAGGDTWLGRSRLRGSVVRALLARPRPAR